MRLLSFFILFLIVGCTTTPVALWAPTPHPDALEKAVYLKSQKKLDQAEAEVQSYLEQTKDIYWQGAALLMLGEIQEDRDQAAEAMETYRKLLNHGAGYESHQAAKALYKMSWLYERQNNCEQVIATLTDLKKVLLKGDEFIKRVETPARLANCYYVLNHWDRAMNLRTESLQQLKVVNSDNLPNDVRWRSYLYIQFVGMNPMENTDRRLATLIEMGQKDLLNLLERAPAPINEIAFAKLFELYDSLFKLYTNKPKPKNAVEKEENNQQLLKELASFVDHFEELRAARSPKDMAVNETEMFFMKMQNLEERARTIARQLEVGMQKEKKQKR